MPIVSPIPSDLNVTFSSSTAPVTQGVTLAVYAPFGTDEQLTNYLAPSPTSPRPVAEHPLVKNLCMVSDSGANVSALIDLHNDYTWLVEIDAFQRDRMRCVPYGKQDMSSPFTLASFLQRTRERFRVAGPAGQSKQPALVLALESHGAGFLPDIRRHILSDGRLAGAGRERLPTHGAPLLTMGSPMLPVNHMPLSTWGLAEGLRLGLHGATPAKLAVLHLNNCFNMSVELLHTVAPHADFAAGYMNYNFFTAGASYPWVFRQLRAASGRVTSSENLAKLFAEGNRKALRPASATEPMIQPTVGGVVQLARMSHVAAAIDRLALALALVGVLRPASGPARRALVEDIRRAIRSAQQYDTVDLDALDAPNDELTDILSLAQALAAMPGVPGVPAAATNLVGTLAGVGVYGESGTPWPLIPPGSAAPAEPAWRFDACRLAMNILCPDPGLIGTWDWRSPWYLEAYTVREALRTGSADPRPEPLAQPNLIAFLQDTAWVDFIVEYHREVPFVGLLPAAIPRYYLGKAAQNI